MKLHIVRAMNSYDLSGNFENWFTLNQNKLEIKHFTQIGPAAIAVLYEEKSVPTKPVEKPAGPTRKIQTRKKD